MGCCWFTAAAHAVSPCPTASGGWRRFVPSASQLQVVLDQSGEDASVAAPSAANASSVAVAPWMAQRGRQGDERCPKMNILPDQVHQAFVEEKNSSTETAWKLVAGRQARIALGHEWQSSQLVVPADIAHSCAW